MKRAPTRVLCLAMLALAYSPALAQEEPSPRACFRPGPAARCRSFWITEFGIGRQVTRPGVVYDTFPGTSYPAGPGTDSVVVVPPQPYTYRPAQAVFVTWEIGGMLNRAGREDAVGASVFVSAPFNGRETTRYGVRARYRRWSDAGMALDLGTGMFVTRPQARVVDREAPGRRLGVTLQAAASPAEWLGLVAQADGARGAGDAQVGARLSSRVGAVAGIAAPVVGLLLFMMFPEG